MVVGAVPIRRASAGFFFWGGGVEEAGWQNLKQGGLPPRSSRNVSERSGEEVTDKLSLLQRSVSSWR